MPACILERLKLSSAALNLRPALIIQLFIDCAVQPVQLVSCPVFARIPALLDEVALRLFERDARFNSNQTVSRYVIEKKWKGNLLLRDTHQSRKCV